MVSTSFAVHVISNMELCAVSVTMATARLPKQTLSAHGKQACSSAVSKMYLQHFNVSPYLNIQYLLCLLNLDVRASKLAASSELPLDAPFFLTLPANCNSTATNFFPEAGPQFEVRSISLPLLTSRCDRTNLVPNIHRTPSIVTKTLSGFTQVLRKYF
jgi:hypothetical protein